MVHARAELAQISEADAEFQQLRKFMRRIPARRDADLVNRAPEAIAGMRVVMAHIGRPRTCRRADEDEAKIMLELVRKFFHAGDCRVG